MTLQVIGAGFGRTGTFSIKLALEALGFGPCHHMDDLFASPERLAVWQNVADSTEPEWDSVFTGYASTIDWPSTNYWQALAVAYPDAKILLSVRPAEDWWISFDKTIRKLIESRDQAKSKHLRAVLDYAHRIIAEDTFAGRMGDRQAALDAYRRRVDEVVASVAGNRLLVFNVKEGWPPLCDFLGVPAPEDAFPRSNDAVDFWQHFGADEPLRAPPN